MSLGCRSLDRLAAVHPVGSRSWDQGSVVGMMALWVQRAEVEDSLEVVDYVAISSSMWIDG